MEIQGRRKVFRPGFEHPGASRKETDPHRKESAHMKIIVTGGGLIGPTLARRLRPAGHDGRRRPRDSRPIAFLFCSQARDPRR
jgi:hypothetical protein